MDKNRHLGDAPGELRELGRHVVAHLIAAGIVGAITTAVVKFLPWAQLHRTLVIIAALNVFTLICIALAAVYATGRNKGSLLRYKSIAESCGIEGFHSLQTPEEKEAGWAACTDKIKKVSKGELRIAVFTGASTFSYESKQANHLSPLREAVLEHKGDLKILMMQKGCDAWRQCIERFGSGDKAARYRQELEDGYDRALDFCDGLAKTKPYDLRSIEVRAYDRPPLWKMVFMGTEHIWLQYYIPGQHVDDRPAYIVNCAVPGGMAHPLESVFDYRWEMSKDRVLVHRDETGKRIV